MPWCNTDGKMLRSVRNAPLNQNAKGYDMIMRDPIQNSKNIIWVQFLFPSHKFFIFLFFVFLIFKQFFIKWLRLKIKKLTFNLNHSIGIAYNINLHLISIHEKACQSKRLKSQSLQDSLIWPNGPLHSYQRFSHCHLMIEYIHFLGR